MLITRNQAAVAFEGSLDSHINTFTTHLHSN